MPVGRPKFEITKAVCKKAEKFAANGLTQAQIADSLGICERSLYTKKKEYLQFLQAIQGGQISAIYTATGSLMNKVKEGDVPAIKYFLNNRDSENWKDKHTTELTGVIGLHEQFVKSRAEEKSQ